MGKFIEDKKNKNQDLIINLVSCGKSFDETSGNEQVQATNVPLEDDLGLKIYVSPRNDAQGHRVVIGPENNTTNVPPKEENIDEQEQGQELDECDGNSQEQEQEENNEDDIEPPLPKGARAKVSRPPGKRPTPKPGTG